ncbi:MAG TPA: leucyl/phenylalanyl-tRNA--protein transferase [Ignavibacteriaceae bacterium]|nr:leucyl/phenylalanyl-tRNA--protein transferase [Ignavibacteriaceae bacterium]
MVNDKLNKSDWLKPENMIRLYAAGAFPMADEDTGKINWYMPEVRTIIPLNNYNFPRSLKKEIEKSNFEFRFDFDFLQIVNGCADRENTWISDELIAAYLKLKEHGYVHTVETWKNGKLIGGLYGISYGGAFFGESMFSRESQASKAALIKLLEHLNQKNFVVLDVQYITSHLEMFGAIEISFDEFNRLLQVAYSRECVF